MNADKPTPQNGWQVLRKENERGFRARFEPLRNAMHRNELFGSVVELFVSAIAGVAKLNLRDEPEQTDQP